MCGDVRCGTCQYGRQRGEGNCGWEGTRVSDAGSADETLRIASSAVMGVFVLIPVGCALAAIAFAFAGVADRSAADAYSAAPTCAAVGPASPAQCRRLLPAVIESTRVVRSAGQPDLSREQQFRGPDRHAGGQPRVREDPRVGGLRPQDCADPLRARRRGLCAGRRRGRDSVRGAPGHGRCFADARGRGVTRRFGDRVATADVGASPGTVGTVGAVGTRRPLRREVAP